ncbi:MAG: Smr/MutS family protein [Wolbachia endosymbiont of Tyrophagus putrescentiae]|nr:Smr/MutS family protein [Wolbachia endosymbiont of Tyrophagus putrescentiae]
MLDDWQKNVKPIKEKKVIFSTDHKINLQPANSDRCDYSSAFSESPFCLIKLKVDSGKYLISGKLDLHGYSIESAYHTFVNFIVRNYQIGNRCLLVITGYGNKMNKMETIKSNLPKWLVDIRIRNLVLYHQQATEKHGGKGAFYILLRKNRNS